jgi:hypothetical protein
MEPKVYILDSGLETPIYYTSCSCAGDGCSCGLIYNLEKSIDADTNTKRNRKKK